MTDDTSGMHDLPAPVALGTLDPTRDAAFDARMRSIGAAAATHFARSSAPRTALSALGAWALPAAAAAIVVLLSSVAALALTPRPVNAAPATFAESTGIPATVVAWAMAPDAASSSATVMDAIFVSRGAGR